MSNARVYEYGTEAPTLELEEVERQMHEAHQYKNELIAIEIQRRERTETLVREHFPQLLEFDAQFALIEQQIETVLQRTKQQRKESRSRVAVSAADKAELAQLKAQRKELNAARKAERKRAFGTDEIKDLRKQLSKLRGGRTRRKIEDTPEILSVKSQLDGLYETWFSEVPQAAIFQQRLAEVNEENKERRNAEYNARDLYWGTKLAVLEDLDSICKLDDAPNFKRWRGDGRIAVQNQLKRNEDGERIVLTPATLHGCQGTMLQLPLPQPGAGKRTVCRMRIGSVDRAPRWTEFTVYLDRPLPDDVEIKGARLIRYRLASHCRWKLQLILVRPSGWVRTDRATDGIVGIDVGWRILPEGLRIAYWAGDDGAHGQVVLPATPGRGWDRVYELKSLRDTAFNEMRDSLVSWLVDASEPPAWLVERTEHLAQWRAQGKLASVALLWRDGRFEGDQTIFPALEVWRRQDKRWWEEERNLADKLQTHRREIYRVFARRMARRYRMAVLEDWDLREAARRPKTDEETVDAVRLKRTAACISELRNCLAGSGLDLLKVDPAGTTMTCVECAHVYDFDRLQLTTVCPACGVSADQDRRAALNLLHAGMHPAEV